MAPRSSRASGADTDTSMVDEPIRQLPVDPMVSSAISPARGTPIFPKIWGSIYHIKLHMSAYQLTKIRTSTRRQIIQRIPIRILILLLVVLLVSLSTPMAVSDVPRQPNSVEVCLERNMIFLANPRCVLEYLIARAGTISDFIPGR
jgi:hypothetical protein